MSYVHVVGIILMFLWSKIKYCETQWARSNLLNTCLQQIMMCLNTLNIFVTKTHTAKNFFSFLQHKIHWAIFCFAAPRPREVVQTVCDCPSASVRDTSLNRGLSASVMPSKTCWVASDTDVEVLLKRDFLHGCYFLWLASRIRIIITCMYISILIQKQL